MFAIAHHIFDEKLAVEYGVNEAIFIDHLQKNIQFYRAHDENFFEGRYWHESPQDYLSDLFPFWTERQRNYVIKSLINKNVIISGNFNESKMNRTRWFAFVDEEGFLGPRRVPNKKTQEAMLDVKLKRNLSKPHTLEEFEKEFFNE